MKLLRFTLLSAAWGQNETIVETTQPPTVHLVPSTISSTTTSTTTTTRVIMGEEAGDELFHACEKYYDQKVNIEIGLHGNWTSTNKARKIERKKDEAIRETLAEELTPIAGLVCVTEGQFFPHVNENIIEIPLHIYGNGTKTEKSIEKIIAEHAKINGTDLELVSKHWPAGAFIMKVGDKTTEEIRRKLLKDEETGERRWVLPLLIVLMTGGVLFILYIRGNQTVRRMFFCCPGQVERNQMQPISRFDSDERLV